MVEVLGKGAAESGWSARDTRVAGAVLGTLAVLGAVWSAVTVGSPLAGILLGVLTLLLLGGGAALAHAAGDVPAGALLGALAAVTGAAFGVVLLGPPVGAAHVVVAAAVVVLVAATGPALVDGGDAVFLGLGLTALLALLGGALVLLTGATPARAAAVVAPLALALTTVTPTLALRLSRIPRPPLPRTAADLADVPGQLELDRVLDRVRRARALLSGLVAGCYAAAALGVVTLTTDTTGPWPAVLAAVLTVLLLLRARLFRHRAQVAAPLAAVAVILVAAVGAVTASGAGGVVRLAVVPLVALVLGGVACAVGGAQRAAAPGRPAVARPRRAGDAAAARRRAGRAGGVGRLHAAAGDPGVRGRRAATVLALVVALSGLATATAPAALAACREPAGPGAPLPAAAGQEPLIDRLGLRRVWELSTGRGVTVAVVDSGVDARHPKLAGAVEQPVDFRTSPTGAGFEQGRGTGDDCENHGTPIAGIIAARAAGDERVLGIAPDARIAPVRFDGALAQAPTEMIAAAVRAGADRGRVLNLSFAVGVDEPAIRKAVQYAVDRDVVVVAAAGNEARSQPGLHLVPRRVRRGARRGRGRRGRAGVRGVEPGGVGGRRGARRRPDGAVGGRRGVRRRQGHELRDRRRVRRGGAGPRAVPGHARRRGRAADRGHRGLLHGWPGRAHGRRDRRPVPRVDRRSGRPACVGDRGRTRIDGPGRTRSGARPAARSGRGRRGGDGRRPAGLCRRRDHGGPVRPAGRRAAQTRPRRSCPPPGRRHPGGPAGPGDPIGTEPNPDAAAYVSATHSGPAPRGR